MAEKKEYATRFGMGLLALLFLVTSVGFSILVIYQAKVENNKKKQAEIQAAAQEAIAKDTNKPKTGDTGMKGTILKDFTTVAKVDSLQKIDLVEGTGAEVKAGDTVTAHYTGALASSGVIFESSHDGENKPIPFSLNGVIEGWSKGVPGMKIGGSRRLIIPAEMAYGPVSKPGIPANSDLVFDIELIGIN